MAKAPRTRRQMKPGEFFALGLAAGGSAILVMWMASLWMGMRM